MSAQAKATARVTTRRIVEMKAEGRKIAMLTAYDYPFSQLLDEAGVDVILVGDSAGMVVHGHPTTLPMTMDDMLRHTQAVARGVRRALVVTDMPFLSYQTGISDAVRNAGRFLQEGAQAVKLEGGSPVVETVRRLVDAGIPVMAHLGLTPQSVHQLGGFAVQGRDADHARRLQEDALALEEAGAFSLVLESIPALLAHQVTTSLKIPTIGIGAGIGCDGQVLVTHDMLGLFDRFTPKFVKRYAEIGRAIQEAAGRYVQEVQSGQFPGPEHTYGE